LIFTLDQVDVKTRKSLIYIIRNKYKSKADIQQVIDTVKEAGGINYASRKMDEYKNNAIAMLHTLNESPERMALEELVRYTTERRK
jgi:octaprenyl-diphosphate synthase